MKSDRQITLAEFRAWLEGVEELQTAKWSPNAVQWKLIRKKLDLIVADTVVQYISQQHPQHAAGGQQQVRGYHEANQDETALPTPRIPTDLNSVPIEHQPAIGGISARGGRIITPNIDTSVNNFASSFE